MLHCCGSRPTTTSSRALKADRFVVTGDAKARTVKMATLRGLLRRDGYSVSTDHRAHAPEKNSIYISAGIPGVDARSFALLSAPDGKL